MTTAFCSSNIISHLPQSSPSSMSSSLSLITSTNRNLFYGTDHLNVEKKISQEIRAKLQRTCEQRASVNAKGKEDKNIRKKREIDQNCRNGICCLKSLYFDFGQQGMDYIIKPAGFNINFCEGECNNMQILKNDRDMLILQDGINHPESPFQRRLSCCVPTKWSSLEIVENRNGTEIKRKLKDVKALECGCII
ncbi:unnamed protein product [Thelazia callipaeda]|uniref:TGF_BETA_2 domain-containing protein n=1 Tax=Thelazia callipaeda TaxID=103827 RepID=A0A0N5D7N5_THECL|nr:unnamed protein product [Thelazia callipaeda]